MKSPNFFVVGAVKAGTTSIGFYLSKHPDIYISPIKEPHYFCKDINPREFPLEYKKNVLINVTDYLKKSPLSMMHVAHIESLLDYQELFREANNEKAGGELSSSYLYSKVAAENIFKFNHSSKIVMILRQPVERAYSHYLADIKGYATADVGFIKALECDFSLKYKGWGSSHLYIELGLYFEQVSRYLKLFPESQIKILLYEDLQNDPIQVIKELCRFLEVDPSLLNEKDVLIRKNVAALPRFKISVKYLPIFNAFKNFISIILPNRIKPQVMNVMLSNKNVPKLREEEFEQAIKYFSEDIQKLSVLIKRDLQSWHQFK